MKYSIFSLCVICAVWMFSPAQAQNTLPELKARYNALGKTPHDDTLRVDLLMRMAQLYSRVSMDSCREAITDAIRLSKRIGHKSGYGQALNGLAIVENMLGNTEKALEGYEEALKVFTEIDYPAGQAGCHTNLGALYADMGREVEAVPHYLQAMSILRRKDTMGLDLGIVYLNLGTVYMMDSTTLTLAPDYLAKAVAIADQTDDFSFRVSSYLTLGKYYRKVNKTTEALGLGLKVLQLAREQEDLHGIAEAYSYMTEVYVGRGDHEKALQYLNEAEAAFAKIEDKIQLMDIFQQKGDLLVKMGDPAAALEVYKKVMVIYRRTDVPANIRLGYENLAKAYEALGDAKAAAQNRDKALEIKD